MPEPIPEPGRQVQLQVLRQALEDQTVYGLESIGSILDTFFDWPDTSKFAFPVWALRRLEQIGFLTTLQWNVNHWEGMLTPAGKAYIEAWQPNGWDA